MGYNLSKRSVRRHFQMLTEMATDKTTMRFPADKPLQAARRLREALRAAQEHVDDFPQFDRLGDFYEIKAIEGGVEARWLGDGIKTRIGRAVKPTPPPVKRAGRETMETMNFDDVNTLNGAVGAAVKFGLQADELYFPKLLLTNAEKERLHLWCSSTNWLIIDQEEEGLTLTRRKVPDDLVWRPVTVEEEVS